MGTTVALEAAAATVSTQETTVSHIETIQYIQWRRCTAFKQRVGNVCMHKARCTLNTRPYAKHFSYLFRPTHSPTFIDTLACECINVEIQMSCTREWGQQHLFPFYMECRNHFRQKKTGTVHTQATQRHRVHVYLIVVVVGSAAAAVANIIPTICHSI